MRLEDEIKTKSFRSQRQKLHINLVYTNNWLQSRAARVFTSHGITAQQYNILRILRGQHPKPCNIQLLKDRMLDKQPDVSRLIDRLVQKKLTDRKICEDDRRKMDIVITKQGLQLLEEMEEGVKSFDDWSNHMTEAEVTTLNDLLDKLRG